MAREVFGRKILRHWRGILQVLFRLGVLVGIVVLTMKVLDFIGPEPVPRETEDEAEEFREARRVAFCQARRSATVLGIILSAVIALTLLAVYYSRRPVEFSTRKPPVTRAGPRSSEVNRGGRDPNHKEDRRIFNLDEGSGDPREEFDPW